MFSPMWNSILLGSCGDYLQTAKEKGTVAADAARAAHRATTGPILIFEAVVLLSAVGLFLYFRKSTKSLGRKSLAMAAGAFLFELFTSPMWMNAHLGQWAYVHCDVSWILTVGWTTMILGVVLLVDRAFPAWSEARRFALYLPILLVLVSIAEGVVVGLGIRSYAPEVSAVLSGINFNGVPIEILYYVPVFTTLVIAFYKYWSFVIDDALLVPVKKRNWLRGFILAFIAVSLWEIVIEPLVDNKGFPGWSYVFRDLNILYTGQRVLMIAIGAVIIERLMIGQPILLKFGAAVALISLIALPIESWFIVNGYRVYGPSAVLNYSGFKMPISGVPIEIAFAIPCYLSLIIGFIRYWEIVFDNEL